MRALLPLAAVTALAISGLACERSEAPASGTTSPAPKGDATVRVGNNGQSRVDGAPLKGDPKVCAAFTSCCTAPGMGMFCGLTQVANNGDCAKSLKDAKQYAKESNIALPAGCK